MNNKDILRTKKKIIIFANTIWFLDKFKYELIEKLLNNYHIECLYLRNGPTFDTKRIDSLVNRGVILRRFSFGYLLKYIFQCLNPYSKIKKFKLYRLIVFTISPIILSSLFFFNLRSSTIIVLEGLGRVFSSKLIIFRILKKFMLIFYKLLFKDCKNVVVLNYSDSTYLTELGIVSINKINVIPGTGINTEYLDGINNYDYKQNKYIDYIARAIPDKGFNIFLNTKIYLNKFNKDFVNKYPFRIIIPQSDIDIFSKQNINFIKSLGIEIKPYISNQLDYFADTKAILFPTKYGEGLSRVVMESVYLGIPLLLSRNQGTEQILPFDYKYFIKSYNPSSIAEQLNELIKDEEYFERILFTQKDKLKKMYSITASIDEFCKLID